jgi:hypothetical protein
MPADAQSPELVTQPLAATEWPLIKALFRANGTCDGCWRMW